MRYSIQNEDGSFVMLLAKSGMDSLLVTYTEDSRDAHDFKTAEAAKEFMKKKKLNGQVVELTDEGFWPVMDD